MTKTTLRAIGVVYVGVVLLLSLSALVYGISNYLAFELLWPIGFEMLNILERWEFFLSIFLNPIFELIANTNTFLDNNWSYFGKYLKYIFWVFLTLFLGIPVILGMCFWLVVPPYALFLVSRRILAKNRGG